MRSGARKDVDANLGLLGDGKWMDIRLIYANDQRAILSLEKGTAPAAPEAAKG